MGVSYEPRAAPLEPSKRGKVSGNVSSEEPAAKKSKKEATSGVGSTSAQVVLGKPPRGPTFKLAVDRAEAQKKKVSEASKYSFRIADSDIGSPAFMKALRATERSVPWGLGSRGRPIEIDIEQFGSLHADPDNVGAVIIDLHRKSSAPHCFLNLVNDESEDEDSKVVVPSAIAPKVAETAELEKVQASPEAAAMLTARLGLAVMMADPRGGRS